jgi:hypothetical protein
MLILKRVVMEGKYPETSALKARLTTAQYIRNTAISSIQHRKKMLLSYIQAKSSRINGFSGLGPTSTWIPIGASCPAIS